MTSTKEETDLHQLLNNEPTCEIQWQSGGPECGNPAAFIILGHDTRVCDWEEGFICEPCLSRGLSMGFTSPSIACPKCMQGPVIKAVRPI